MVMRLMFQNLWIVLSEQQKLKNYPKCFAVLAPMPCQNNPIFHFYFFYLVVLERALVAYDKAQRTEERERL